MDVNEEFMNKFVEQVGGLVETKLTQSRNEYGVMLEQKMDEFRIYQDQLNTMSSKLDAVIKDVSEIKSDIVEMKNDIHDLKQDNKQIKEYLMTNLEPRVNILESVVA
jgi:septal ring factor EnvC (AmiA/AmiB activator)